MQAEQQVVVASSCFKLLGCSWGGWAGWPATRSIILYWQNICVFSGSGLVEITKLVLARPDFSSCWAGVRPGFLCVPLESFPFRLTGPVVRISKKKKVCTYSFTHGSYRCDHHACIYSSYTEYGCIYLVNFFGFGYYITFVCIWQLVSNYRLIRLKRFISSFTTKLCN